MSTSLMAPFSGSRSKWEGVEEALQRGAPGSAILGKGTQEEGQVDSGAALHRGDPALLPRGWVSGPQTRHRAARGRGKALDSTCGGGLSGSTEHSQLCWGKGSQSRGRQAKPPTYPQVAGRFKCQPLGVPTSGVWEEASLRACTSQIRRLVPRARAGLPQTAWSRCARRPAWGLLRVFGLKWGPRQGPRGKGNPATLWIEEA